MRDNDAQRLLFEEHARRHGGDPPDFVFLNAGVIDRLALLDDSESKWQATLDIDLRSVIVGVTLAASEAKKKLKGCDKTATSIVVVASAGGL